LNLQVSDSGEGTMSDIELATILGSTHPGRHGVLRGGN
jgi:hypothetical protein